MGRVEARKRRASTRPIPVGLSGPTVKLTVLEDEFRVATGLVSSYALVGREDRRRLTRTDSRRSERYRLEQSSGRVRRVEALVAFGP